jgi:hypothetical protein
MKQEFIICSAIWVEDGIKRLHQPSNIESGIVVCGWRHFNCIALIKELYPEKLPLHVQGFITSDGRFVDRIEGCNLAFLSGQVKQKDKPLMSEDLY